MKQIPIAFDTDIAGDFDDAGALNLVLNSPEVSVELIISADEHLDHRARFAREFALAKGRNIPVVRGVDLGNTKYCHACQAGRDIPSDGIGANVVAAVLKVLERHPDMRYVCIAPQSNLALVVDALGEQSSSLNVLAMAGAINYRRKDVAEHNIRCDIVAARTVFASSANLTYVLSDTTFNPAIEINAGHPFFQQLAASPLRHHRMMVESALAFFAGKFSSSFMHDPLTVATIWRNDLVQFREARLAMNEKGQMTEHPDGRVMNVSTHADYAAFMQLLTERL